MPSFQVRSQTEYGKRTVCMKTWGVLVEFSFSTSREACRSRTLLFSVFYGVCLVAIAMEHQVKRGFHASFRSTRIVHVQFS